MIASAETITPRPNGSSTVGIMKTPDPRRIRFSQSRASIVTGSVGRRLAGLAVFLLALLIALPVPGTNAPRALIVFIMTMGLIRGGGCQEPSWLENFRIRTGKAIKRESICRRNSHVLRLSFAV
jgi:hypothetical protein